MPLINIIARSKELIRDRVVELIKAEFGISEVDTSLFKFEIPPEEKMGHLAFACFPLAKVARKAPQTIAQSLAQAWGETDQFQKVEAAGPYLNFYLSPRYLAQELIPLCTENGRYGDNDLGAGKTVMLEYSSPNTNKPLHLGHGRNNQLGIVLSRLLERNGYRVVKANLVNDRGVHICKSMLAYKNWGAGETPESLGQKGDKLVGSYYVLYDKKEKENPDILEKVQQMLRDWEAGDPGTIELWKKMNGWVLQGFRQTYDRMGAAFDKYYFESETYKGGRELVQEALEKGICYRESNGAIGIDLEKEKLGKKILLRGDGTSMYVTQDINTTVTKFKDFDLEGCLFVVASEQDNHFRVLFTILDKLGFEWAERCEHISYGMCNLPEGKMKSREGTVVDLDDLMDEMKEMALDELKARYSVEDDAVDDDLTAKAEAIGQAAIKYFILRTNATKEIVFNPKESLSFDGNTGPYLQYTHARICSLLKKADEDGKPVSIPDYQWNPNEVSLLVQLGRYPDTIRQSTSDRNPAVLCAYIYDLCRSYNKFYYEHPIIKAESDIARQSRISLSVAVKNVLNKTLTILGIEPLEKM
ncbi:MAG: arginine--tRNA ligase [Proteobacteria bacterium]|nr:arginine--tRNA ligase [Pseudomonadota bacterium]